VRRSSKRLRASSEVGLGRPCLGAAMARRGNLPRPTQGSQPTACAPAARLRRRLVGRILSPDRPIRRAPSGNGAEVGNRRLSTDAVPSQPSAHRPFGCAVARAGWGRSRHAAMARGTARAHGGVLRAGPTAAGGERGGAAEHAGGSRSSSGCSREARDLGTGSGQAAGAAAGAGTPAAGRQPSAGGPAGPTSEVRPSKRRPLRGRSALATLRGLATGGGRNAKPERYRDRVPSAAGEVAAAASICVTGARARAGPPQAAQMEPCAMR